MRPPGLPPEDRRLSPYTGWTRAHWERAADLMLDGVRPHATPRFALYHLPRGRESISGHISDGFEGFARTFLLAAFRLAGAAGVDPGGLAERYAAGMVAGTSADPGNERWPDLVEVRQARVEAASVAIGLYETRPWIWDRLSDTERERIIAWFGRAHGQRYVPNNWFLFQVMLNAFLKSVGAPYRQDEIDVNLDRIDAMYRSDGWYTDGAGQNYDHYVGWAMHLYTALWCRMDGDQSDPARAAEYRRRLSRYLEQFRFLWASDGAPLYQGRSLIYRFAAVAPLFAGHLLGSTPLHAGETRRIASGSVRHFLEHGALADGVLSMGWHGEFLPMAQGYSGPASPYWASKAFLGLLLPSHDAVWQEREQPTAVEQGDFVVAMREPGFLASGTAEDGIVRVYSHKSDHYPMGAMGPGLRDASTTAVYRRLAYSTHSGPEIVPDDGATALDASVSLIDARGAASVRDRIHAIACADRFAASYYHPSEPAVFGGVHAPDWSARIETASIAKGAAEIRIHHVASLGRRTVRDAGFAVAGDAVDVLTGDGWAMVRSTSGLTSFIAGLHGFDESQAQSASGRNAFGDQSAFPFLASTQNVHVEGVYASCSILTAARLDPELVLAKLPRVAVEGRTATIRFDDGEECYVQLVAAEHVSITLAGIALAGHIRFARVSPDRTSFVLER